MKPCVYNSSSACSLTLQLSHPFSTCTAFPCSSQFLFSSTRVARNGIASLSWLCAQRRRPKPIHVTVLFLNGDGTADIKKYEDNWYSIHLPKLKLPASEVLKRWGPSVAVGAMVGSIIAQKTVIFVMAFSFVVLMAAHNAMEAQGVPLNRVSDMFSRRALTNLLNAVKLSVSRVILQLADAIMCAIRSSRVHTLRLSVPMHSFLLNKHRNGGNLLPLNQRPASETGKNSTAQSHSTFIDTLTTDIDACLRNVDGMISREKDMPMDTKWVDLKDSLASLKTKLAILSRGDQYAPLSTRMSETPGPAIKEAVKKLEPSVLVNSVVNSPEYQEADKLHAFKVEDLTVMMTNFEVLKQDVGHQRPGQLDAVVGQGDELSPPGSNASTRLVLPAANEAAQLQVSNLLFKELNCLGDSETQRLDAVGGVKSDEQESCRGFQSKYIDYWTEQDQDGSISSSVVKPKNCNKLLTKDYTQSKGLGLQDAQDLWRENGLKVAGFNSEVKSTCFDEHAPNVHTNEMAPASANDLFVRVKNLVDPEEHLSSVTNERVSRNPVPLYGDDSMAGGRLSAHGERIGTQQKSVALLGSTKELAFVREDADLHVLTGFSRKINDGKFQMLMNDGETALRYGKAGLFGDLEVREAETILHKAADYFASAAALDPSSIEAVGFWGNTLLVHGELKLMLSRELRHMISTADVLSPYWIKRIKGTEGSNLAALQKSFQSVCEECEELLVQAGRKYRTVLSVSNSEVRALYNWGLALCFRAQLIAEEGGQDARVAADRIYLAAIDKFEAMMGISRRYAPGAMLNWGLTLKDRSRLRPSDSTEKIELLQQAKQLLIDALRLQPDDAQIHNAFVTCSMELKELNERKESQAKRSTKFFSRKW